MSSYLNFYVRKNDTFVLLDNFSRNSIIYSKFNGAPWEKIAEVNSNMIDNVQKLIHLEVKECEKAIKKLKKKIKLLSATNETIKEKCDWIDEFNEDIVDYKNEIKWEKAAIRFLDFIKRVGENEGNTIYYGCECWEPTVDDVV